LFAHAAVKKEKVTIQVMQNGIGYNSLKKKFGEEMAFVIDGRQGAVPEQKQLRAKPQPVKVLKNDNVIDLDKMGSSLEECVVIGYGATLKKAVTGSVVTVKGVEIPPNNLALALQGKVAGLQIQQRANPMDGQKIVIRGNRSLANVNEPLIVVDGVPMEAYRINALAAADIESITVLKDAAAVAVYGSRAAYGVIVIETKKIKVPGWRINFPAKYFYASQAVQTGNGAAFTVARRFYAPKYLSTEPQERTDFRETIYWNPVIQTDKTGTARVEFYNSDATTTFRAIAEGIGYNGKVGRAEHTYVTQNALAVDAKIPPYLTVGDKALIPLVIRNNRIQDVEARVRLVLPPTMRTTNFTNSILLPADSARQLLIPVTATAVTNGKIQFVVETDLKTETVTLPITAAEKGFPVIETFSGNRSGKHEFTLRKVIPGSVQTQLKLFKTLEGQLLDGIESMLREPYGCFEQTSSTTYPNIFVLKYLRESGRSNKAIEEKALDYIERGYKRLVGFETNIHGFEWFGKTPPHEALTAYGLLEFTDMQEFINVDKHMLERTKKFLLDRRDGKGEFRLSTGGYDRFASVPNKIANIYIVYALTQAGIGKEITLEYETAVKKALASNDGYQLAMMALAASNMKREKDFQTLMDALNANYQKSNLASETSVVNSRDASLRVETASLYALVLMRGPSPDMGTVSNLISRILSEKSYYGYGSTQSTVMALQAIVAYSKLTGRMSENPQITFTMNDTEAMADSSLSAVVQEGKNVFGVQYKENGGGIPYNLQVSYNTFTPPNSEKAELTLSTQLGATQTKVGETIRMDISVRNNKTLLQPMAVAKIGIPAGLSVQPWQLKEILEKNQVAYYEIFDNYLVLYWMGFAPNEIKTIKLDLKAEIPGTYKGKASNTYLYYTPEYKHWNDGVEVEIR
jgi:TonB-dependent SusC/RagA subfamily outer membrane receptor